MLVLHLLSSLTSRMSGRLGLEVHSPVLYRIVFVVLIDSYSTSTCLIEHVGLLVNPRGTQRNEDVGNHRHSRLLLAVMH